MRQQRLARWPTLRACGVDVKLRLEKSEQRTEVFFDAAMRSRCDEKKVAPGIGGERLDEFVALLLRLTFGITAARPSRQMSLVNDDELGRILQ